MDVQYTSSAETLDGANCDDDDEILFKDNSDQEIKAFKYRWFILALYSLTAFSNTLVWLSLFTVTDATCAFYDIDTYMLLWSSNAFTFMQVIIAIPASFLPSKLGLRPTMVLAAAINAIGACIMIAGTHRNGFLFFICGQTIVAIAASILPQLAPEVSAVWFPKSEHAISTSIGIILGNAGAAVGFLQPALLIKNIDVKSNVDYVGEKLRQLIYSQAALCVLLMFAILVFFKGRPKQPPSMSQAIRHGPGGMSFAEFKSNYKKLLKNVNYHLCGNSFALNSVLLVIVPVILNQIMSSTFPNHDATVGWMGFAGIVVGIVGSVLFGFVLDRTQAYKKLALSLSGVSLIFWIGFSESLAEWNNLPLTFTLFVVCLFAFIPFGPILVDMMSEMTYPVPESMSFVGPITVGRFYSIPTVFLLGWLVQEKKFHTSCYVIAAFIALCFVLVFLAKVKLKRNVAEEPVLEMPY